MRFTNAFAFLLLQVLLLVGLTACPGLNSLSYGVVDVGANATNIDRCDDGVKVVVEGIQEEWGFRGPTYSDTSGFRAKGPNWIWVEPGHWHSIQWEVSVNAPASKNPEGKQIIVKAYCMRKDAEPGLSQRTFALSDYIKQVGLPRYNVLQMYITVSDSGTDPSYTVTPPGLTTEDHE
ncbi:hypothetical protein [Oceanithermus sp.]